MADVNAEGLMERAHTHIHRLSGLLTGISAGLFCGKMAADLQSAGSCIEEAQQLAVEAEKELNAIREAIKELEQAVGPQSSE